MQLEIYSQKKAMVGGMIILSVAYRKHFKMSTLLGLFSGVCNASVIFGVGKEKYRTEFVRDNDPTWNEETTM